MSFEISLSSGSIDLAEHGETIWRALKAATADPQHDWRFVQLATVDGQWPRVRTVVLRDVNPAQREIIAHTDRRTGKVTEIQVNPHVEWLAYDRETRTQVVLTGTAEVHLDDAVADEQWNAAAPEILRLYLAPHAPGEPAETASHNLPDDLINRIPTAEELRSARKNFAVIRGVIEEVDILTLNRDGNLRARYQRENNWQGKWVQP